MKYRAWGRVILAEMESNDPPPPSGKISKKQGNYEIFIFPIANIGKLIMDIDMTIAWNVILSLIVAPLILVIRAQIGELRRIDILVNKTREELGRDYVSKMEMETVLDRIMIAIDRLSQKVDRLFEERAKEK